MKRRSLLIGAGTLALGQLLAGCGGRNQPTLRVKLLANSMPAQLLRSFQRQLEQDLKLDFAARPQFADLYDLLAAWKQEVQPKSSFELPFNLPFSRPKPGAVADLVSLGDGWLTGAIQQELVQPLDLQTELPLSEEWQTLVRRDRQGNLDPQGEVWAAPYRVGTMAIAYRPEEFKELGWIPQDWSDLWRSELRGKVSLLDSPRAVIGLTLKKLGQSVNTENLNRVSRLKAELQALHQQVRFYSSDAYLQPLLLGDTWAAVGWSTDLLPLVGRDRRIAAVVPQSGTIQTADLWVRPAGASTEESARTLAAEWINFCWRPEIATQLSVLSSAISPVILGRNPVSDLPPALRDNPLRLPPIEVRRRSEFLLPLAAATVEQYRELWIETRQTG